MNASDLCELNCRLQSKSVFYKTSCLDQIDQMLIDYKMAEIVAPVSGHN